jgi:hypothetical protein
VIPQVIFVEARNSPGEKIVRFEVNISQLVGKKSIVLTFNDKNYASAIQLTFGKTKVISGNYQFLCIHNFNFSTCLSNAAFIGIGMIRPKLD